MPNAKDQLGNAIEQGSRIIIGARVLNIPAPDSICVKPTHSDASPLYLNPAHGVQVIAEANRQHGRLPLIIEERCPQNRPITIEEAFTLDCIVATIVNAAENDESSAQTLTRIRNAVHRLDALEEYGSPCPPAIPAHDFEDFEAEKRRMALGE